MSASLPGGAWVIPAAPDHDTDPDVRPGLVIDPAEDMIPPAAGMVLVGWSRQTITWEPEASLVRVADPDNPGPCWLCRAPLSGRIRLIYGGHRQAHLECPSATDHERN